MESQRGSATCPQSHSWEAEESGYNVGPWARGVSGGAAQPGSGVSGGGVTGMAAGPGLGQGGEGCGYEALGASGRKRKKQGQVKAERGEEVTRCHGREV